MWFIFTIFLLGFGFGQIPSGLEWRSFSFWFSEEFVFSKDRPL